MEGRLAASLWRAALNPAAVFGRSGRPYGGPGLPIVRIGLWYLPAFPTWALLGPADDKVIAGALRRYGERVIHRTDFLPRLYDAANASEPIAPPAIEDVYEAGTLDGKLGFAALHVGPEDYAGVPIAYLVRRYGAASLSWRQDWFGEAPGLLTAWLSGDGLFASGESQCVGLIAPTRVSCTSREQTSG